MKMNNVSRAFVTTLSILIALSLTACILFSVFAPSKDYTKDYETYAKVSEITSTYQLMDYCHTNGIGYSINNGSFKMNGYKTTFTLNQAECAVDNNKHINNFYLLENGRADMVESVTDINGQTIEVFEIRTWGTNYTLSNGNYTLYNMWPAFIACGITLVLVFLLGNYLSFCQKCKRCNCCNAQNTSD